MYLGTGGEFFEPGTAELAIDNENGVQGARDHEGAHRPS